MSIPANMHEKIIDQYTALKLKHSKELEERKRIIYQKVPGYEDLDRQVIDASMDYSRFLLSNGNNPELKSKKLDEYHDKLIDIKMSKKRLLENAGFPYDYLDNVYECDKCLDTGYVDGEQCICYKKKITNYLYDISSMKELLKTNNFSCLSYHYYKDEDLVHFKNAVETCKNYINNFNSDYRNILFYGTVGTGKSFLSCCIAKELIEKGLSVIYYSSNELFRNISDYTFGRDREALNSYLNLLYESDVCIIDDLGTEYVNDFVRNQLFNIVNERILRKKSIIISTNLSLEGIRSNYTDRILSRIYENFEFIRLTTFKDIRLQKKLES